MDDRLDGECAHGWKYGMNNKKKDAMMEWILMKRCATVHACMHDYFRRN